MARGDSMTDQGLTPEARVDLQIHLDRLHDCEERCREGLRLISNGQLTRDEYFGLLDRQAAAHEAWRARHSRYFDA